MSKALVMDIRPRPVNVHVHMGLFFRVFTDNIGLTQKAALPLFGCFAKQNLPQTLTKAL
jgi:hypothetical protein